MPVIGYAVTPDEARDLHVWVDVPSGIEHRVAYFVLTRQDDADWKVHHGDGTSHTETTGWWLHQMNERDEVIEDDPYASLEEALTRVPELVWMFKE